MACVDISRYRRLARSISERPSRSQLCTSTPSAVEIHRAPARDVKRWMDSVAYTTVAAEHHFRCAHQQYLLDTWQGSYIFRETWSGNLPTLSPVLMHCVSGGIRQLFLSIAEDKVEDFLGFQQARAFVIRLLRQPGVYRFVTYLGWQLEWWLPMWALMTQFLPDTLKVVEPRSEDAAMVRTHC